MITQVRQKIGPTWTLFFTERSDSVENRVNVDRWDAGVSHVYTMASEGRVPPVAP
jgi:hypothetical protein